MEGTWVPAMSAFTNWYGVNPDNGAGMGPDEDCVMMDGYMNVGEWYDVACWIQTSAFICESAGELLL